MQETQVFIWTLSLICIFILWSMPFPKIVILIFSKCCRAPSSPALPPLLLHSLLSPSLHLPLTGFQTGLVGVRSTLWWRLFSILISLCLCSGSSSRHFAASLPLPPTPDPLSLDSLGFHLSPPSSCPHVLFVYRLVCTDGHWPINHTKPHRVSSLSRLENVAQMSIRADVHAGWLSPRYMKHCVLKDGSAHWENRLSTCLRAFFTHMVGFLWSESVDELAPPYFSVKREANQHLSTKSQTRTVTHSFGHKSCGFCGRREESLFWICHSIPNGEFASPHKCVNDLGHTSSKGIPAKWHLWKHLKATSCEQCAASHHAETRHAHGRRLRGLVYSRNAPEFSGCCTETISLGVSWYGCFGEHPSATAAFTLSLIGLT